MEPPRYSFRPVFSAVAASLLARTALPKITTVVAPPGFGKTVFLSELYRKFQGHPIRRAWIGLDDRDHSLSSLLLQIEVAIGLTSSGGGILEPYAKADAFDRIEKIRTCLSRAEVPVLLFIDNIDFCKDVNISQVLDSLVFDAPASIKLIVSSSSGSVPFNAARAQLELNLQSIKAAELCMDAAAVVNVFKDAGFESVDAAVIDTIMKKTEGWPAAVRLLQLTAGEEGRVSSDIDLLPNEEQHLADMLSTRLMASFEPGLVKFLLEIAELRHFTPELAEVATGDAGAEKWIQQLVARNVMIIPLEQRRQSYRFHGLFRDYLVKESRLRVEPKRRHAIHVSAAAWFLRNADVRSAFELAVLSADHSLIVEILDAAIETVMLEQGDTSTYIQWIESAKRQSVQVSANCTFWYVWALLFERRFADAQRETQIARALLKKDALSESAALLRTKLGVVEIAAAVHLDEPLTAITVAESWIQENPNGDPFDKAVAFGGGLGYARFARLEYPAAREAFRTAQAAIVQSRSGYGRCWVEAGDGLREIHQGDPAIAEKGLLAFENKTRSAIAPTAGILSVVSVVRARALWECGRFSEAERIVSEELLRAAEFGLPDTTLAALETAIPSAVAGSGEFTVDALRDVVKDYPRRVSVLFELRLIQELLLSNQSAMAVDHASRMRWNLHDASFEDLGDGLSPMESSVARVAAGSLLALAGHFSRAEDCFKSEILLAESCGRIRDSVELHLQCAEIHFLAGAAKQAIRDFSRAVVLTSTRSIYAPFLRRRKLLEYFQEDAVKKRLGFANLSEVSTLANIYRHLGSLDCSRSSDKFSGTDFLNALTPRETELLYLVEAGLDNAQIAERLSVTVRTVKFHLSNLFEKLNVKNRSAAVARARALHLLK